MKRFLTAALTAFFFIALAPVAGGYLSLANVAGLFLLVALLTYAGNGRTLNAHRNGLNLEVWAKYIIERLWKDNAFIKRSYDDSAYVVGGRIVHIPQPGSKPNVVKNRTTLPAAAVRRTDTDVVYTLNEYSTDPTHIPNIDMLHLSFSKQDSVMGDHMSVLNEIVADDMLLQWATGAPVFSTTGGPAAGTVAAVTGQTGTRKGFHHKDLQKLMVQMNAANVPKIDRQVLIDDNMYEFFYDSLGDNQARSFSDYVNAREGIVGRIHNFDVLTRSSVLAATSGNALKALGSALGATDNLCSLAWQKNSVASAIGDVKMFQDTNNPLYYGDIYSGLVMFGGRIRRADNLGIYVIAQGA